MGLAHLVLKYQSRKPVGAEMRGKKVWQEESGWWEKKEKTFGPDIFKTEDNLGS